MLTDYLATDAILTAVVTTDGLTVTDKLPTGDVERWSYSFKLARWEVALNNHPPEFIDTLLVPDQVRDAAYDAICSL